jgi:hypothetical protein
LGGWRCWNWWIIWRICVWKMLKWLICNMKFNPMIYLILWLVILEKYMNITTISIHIFYSIWLTICRYKCQMKNCALICIINSESRWHDSNCTIFNFEFDLRSNILIFSNKTHINYPRFSRFPWHNGNIHDNIMIFIYINLLVLVINVLQNLITGIFYYHINSEINIIIRYNIFLQFISDILFYWILIPYN